MGKKLECSDFFTELEIADAVKESYENAGHNAYYGDGFKDGMLFVFNKLYVEKYKKSIELIKENANNKHHTMTKLGLEKSIDCIREICEKF